MTAVAARKGDGREPPAATLIEVIAPSVWLAGAGDVAAEADRVRRRGATDALAGLAREREHGVAAALGADAALPLAVVDGVGLQREDQRVDDAQADPEDAEARRCRSPAPTRARRRPRARRRRRSPRPTR